jgi:hypothetical protein
VFYYLAQRFCIQYCISIAKHHYIRSHLAHGTVHSAAFSTSFGLVHHGDALNIFYLFVGAVVRPIRNEYYFQLVFRVIKAFAVFYLLQDKIRLVVAGHYQGDGGQEIRIVSNSFLRKNILNLYQEKNNNTVPEKSIHYHSEANPEKNFSNVHITFSTRYKNRRCRRPAIYPLRRNPAFAGL